MRSTARCSATSVVLRRRGRAVAAVVPIGVLRLLEDLDDRMDLVDARAGLAKANKKGGLDVILQDFGSEFFQ